MASKLWGAYSSMLNAYPLSTQLISGFSISFVGDLLAQYLIEKKDYDKKRGVVVACYGGVEIGFEAKIWLPFLDYIFGSQMTMQNAIRKLMFEQITHTPFETACFMKWTNALEARAESFEEKMSRDYFLALVSNIGFWIPVSFINFYLIPIQYRPLYVACTTLVIDTFTSFASHNNLQETFEKISHKITSK